MPRVPHFVATQPEQIEQSVPKMHKKDVPKPTPRSTWPGKVASQKAI